MSKHYRVGGLSWRKCSNTKMSVVFFCLHIFVITTRRGDKTLLCGVFVFAHFRHDNTKRDQNTLLCGVFVLCILVTTTRKGAKTLLCGVFVFAHFRHDGKKRGQNAFCGCAFSSRPHDHVPKRYFVASSCTRLFVRTTRGIYQTVFI